MPRRLLHWPFDNLLPLLEQPWKVTIITAPAPNGGAIAKSEPESVESIEPTFRRRIEQVLSAAVVFDQTALVLGAWGCGVFGNDPAMVARLFGELLLDNGPFANAFEHVRTLEVADVLGRHYHTVKTHLDIAGKRGLLRRVPRKGWLPPSAA